MADQKSSQQKIDTIRRTLRDMLKILKYHTEEINEKDWWGLIVQHGTYKVLIAKQIDNEFIDIQFKIDFDEDSIRRLSDFLSDRGNLLKFYLGLYSVISSPFTSYYIDKDNEDKNLKRLIITTKIFPFHQNVSLKELNDSIQSVVSMGVSGLNYVGITLGALGMRQEFSIQEPPKEMYQ